MLSKPSSSGLTETRLTSGAPSALHPGASWGFSSAHIAFHRLHPPKSLYILASIHLLFTFFVLFIHFICEFFCFDVLSPSHELANQNIYFQSLIQSLIVVII